MALRVGTNWDRQPLGKVSDAELARKLGLCRNTVRAARMCRGIGPWRPSTHTLAQDRHEPASPVLESCLLDALSYYTPKTGRELTAEVMESYGRISDRQVWRALRNLRRRGRVKRVAREDLPYGGLVLVRP